MKKRSDFECLALLSANDSELTRREAYQACAALANSGLTHAEEARLSLNERRLLGVRRRLFAGEIEAAHTTLTQIGDLSHESDEWEGDRQFLLAMSHHRCGEQELAARSFEDSSRFYRLAQNEYKALRGLTNSRIVTANLATSTNGELAALEQKARREGYHDLVGNMQRARAIELLKASRYTEAVVEAEQAMASYDLDGYPEDKAVATVLAALASQQLGLPEEASRFRALVHITDGKVIPYLQIFESVRSSQAPIIPSGHALTGFEWQTAILKPHSILGKIVARVKASPATRDELILSIWGETATHESYHHRLHSALNTLKKTTSIRIRYDGEKYHLI